MKSINFLFVILFQIFISHTATAQTNVVYINGIQNTITEADDTRRIIRDILNNSPNHSGNRRNFSVTNVWNPMGWRGDSAGSDLSQDLMELFLLKTAEENFAADFLQLVRLNNNRASIDRNVAARVNAYVDDMTPGNNSIETNGSITDADMSVTRQAVLNLVTRIKAVGGTVILIAHSQGNLIANLAYARLASDGFDLPNKLRIINIANTSEFSASGLNFTHAGDAAIFSGATATLLKDQSLETLPSQFSNWNRTTPRCANTACNFTVAPATFNSSSTDIPNQSFVDETLDHSIVETYLSTANLTSRLEQGIIFSTNANRFIDRFEDFVYNAAARLTPPTASIAVVTPTPTAGNSVIFQPNITSSPNGGVTEYKWYFGDGTVQMGTASQITHTYKVADTYTVRLEIKDIKGVTNSTSTTVTVASNNSILSTFQSGFYGAGDDGNGGTCYYKNSATAIVAANEYAMSEAKYCLNVTQTAWVVSSESAGKIFTPNGWISTNSPTVQFNTDSAGVVKYAGNEFHNIGITPLTVGATFPTGAKAFIIGITNTRDRYFVWNSNPTNSYLYTHAPNIASMMSQWNTSQNGQSTLSRTNGFGWAFDTPSSPTALSGVARYYDISVAPICTIVGCSRAVVASATWIRTPFTDGTDSIELRTPVGFSDMNLSGNTGQKVVYFKRPSDAGVLEGYRELSGATRNFSSYNRIHFDTQMQNLNLPKTVN